MTRPSLATPAVPALLAALALAPACAAVDDELGPELDDGEPLALTSAEQAGVVAFANHPTTDFALLDVTCALRADGARNILAHRDGADALAGTADDDLFDSFAELDAVPRVGTATLGLLAACAEEHGFVGASFVLTAGEVGALTAESMPSSYFNDVAGELCASVGEEMPACIGPCVDRVQIAAEEWYAELVASWVGRTFASRPAAVEEAQQAAFAAGEAMSVSWANPELIALGAIISCAGG